MTTQQKNDAIIVHTLVDGNFFIVLTSVNKITNK